MDLQVSIRCIFTAEAAQAARASGMSPTFSFSVQPGPVPVPIPVAGDLVSFGDDEAEVFEVCNRMFMFKSSVELVVQLLLGVAPGDPAVPPGSASR